MSGVGRVVGKLRLAGVRIRNYRSFRDFPSVSADEFLEIGNFTTLVGRNDVGKSNLLRAIIVFLDDSKVSPEDFHKDRDGIAEEILIELKFTLPEGLDLSDVSYDDFKELFHECRENDVKRLYKALRDDGSVTLAKVCIMGRGGRINYTYKLNGVEFSRKRCFQEVRERLLPMPIYVNPLQSVDDETSLTKGSVFGELLVPLIENLTLGEGAEKIRDVFEREVRRVVEDLGKELEGRLRRVWDYVEGVSISVAGISLSKSIRFNVYIKDRDAGEIPVTQKGMGVQREMLIEFFDIYRKRKIGKGYVFIVEEPEIFLHPGAQRRFMTILKTISKEGQVLISTHSSIFIDNSDLKHTYLLKRVGGRTVLAVKPQHMDYLSEIGKELGVKPSDALLSNGIIFVEGPSDRDVLEVFAKHLYGPEWDFYDVVIMHLGGSNIEKHNFDDLKRVNPNIAIIADADIESLDEDPCQGRRSELCSLRQEPGIPVFFWKRNGRYVRELENLFTLDAIRTFVANELGIDERLVDTAGYSDIPATAEVPKIIDEIIDKTKHNLRKHRIRPKKQRQKYKKGKDAGSIAEIMAEKDQIPRDVKEILDEILHEFQLK